MNTTFRNLSLSVLLAALLLLLAPGSAWAQTVAGSIAGVVADSTGARIPGAQVTLRSAKSRDERKTKTDGAGVFNFTFVPASTYNLTVTRDGFETLLTKSIEVHPNDKLNLNELHMVVGSENVSVTVEANTDISTSGERSSLITSKDIAKLSTVGRDVSELLKTQAGFSALQTGLDNSTSSSAEVAGAYSGLGNYVGNGATANGASITSDGANVTDPGSGAGQTQIVNMDMVQEVKIETSNFGADTAKGPTVITAVGKSGGQTYHGNAQLYARSYVLNAQDWFAKFQSLPQIPDRYLYPGFGIGGPLLFPHSNFNHNRKLTFQANAEGYLQSNSYAYGGPIKSFLQALVPTQAMRNGDFGPTSLANYLGVDTATVTSECSTVGKLANYLHTCAIPTSTNGSFLTANPGRSFTGGTLSGGIEPHANAILNAYYPLPTGPTVNGFNYHTLNLQNPTIFQGRIRLDYALNDSNKFYIVYNGQFGHTDAIPENIYYSPGTSNSAIIGGVDTPGKTNSIARSNLGSVNYTRILSQRASNEMFFGISTAENYYNAGNRNLLKQSTWGYGATGIYPTASDQLPAMATYSTTGSQILPFAITPDFSAGQYIAKKFLPSGGDNLSYQVKGHTLKVGFYAERDTANQTNLSPQTNGTVSTYYENGVTVPNCGTSSGSCGENYLADFFLGSMGSFTQQNFNAQTNLYYWTISGYATDSWKVTPRLTLDYGLRLDHIGPWNDKHGLGMPIFSDAIYQADNHVTPYNNPDGSLFLPGIRWKGGNIKTNANAGYSAAPNSGAPGRWAFISPRVGLALDVHGNGTTIVRGGWGMYRAHDSWNDFVGPAGTSEGAVTATAGGSGYITFNALTNPGLVCNASGSNGCPSIFALDPKDDQQPLTETYSFSVSQRMPGSMVFDIAYVGNTSTHLLTDNASNTAVNSNDLRDINAIPIGAYFKPDPNPASATFGQVINPSSLTTQQANDFRRYSFFQHIGVPRHITYANYNALQATLNRQRGRFNYGLNYTFSKAQGVRGAYQNGLTGDPTNLRANYGPLAFDRTHIVNLSYSFDSGKSIKSGSRLVRGLANGWLVSGITNLQSGPNLQAVGSPNLFLSGNATTSYNGATCGTNTQCGITSNVILGTPDVLLQPTLVTNALCTSGNPGTNLKSRQYINGNCFGLPAIGVNGPANLGYLRGPAFFNSDMTVQKTIAFHDTRNIQFRVAAFNFLNHPLISFSSRYPAEAALRMNGASFGAATISNGYNGQNCSVDGSPCFGYAGYKTGRRVLEVSAKYNF